MCGLCSKKSNVVHDVPEYDEKIDKEDSSLKNKLITLRRNIWSLRKNISILNHDIVGCSDATDDTLKTLVNFVGDIRATIKNQ